MRRTALLAVSLSSLAVPASGQLATFVGVVSDSATGLSVAGASVEVLEQGISAVTDSVGRFQLEELEGGFLTIRVRRMGYYAGFVAMDLTVTRSITVDLGRISLSPAATELEPVVVEAEALNERLHDVGFFRRKQTEAGTFLTHEEIMQLNPMQTSELLRRIPGFRVSVGGFVASGRGAPSIQGGFSRCGVQYYIDGVHADGSDLNTVIPRAIAGMEVYTGAASIPPLYRVAGNPRCGVVLIWTRSGRSP